MGFKNDCRDCYFVKSDGENKTYALRNKVTAEVHFCLIKFPQMYPESIDFGYKWVCFLGEKKGID